MGGEILIMDRIHVICTNPESGEYMAYFVANPFWRFTSWISAMDAVGSLLKYQKDAIIKVVDLDEKVKL